VRLADRLTLEPQTSPGKAITGDWRVLKRERTLTEFTFTCGEYAVAIWETNAGVINGSVAQPSGDVNPDEREGGLANDANLVMNADFTTGLRREHPGDFDSNILPGWLVFSGASSLDAMAVVRDSPGRGLFGVCRQAGCRWNHPSIQMKNENQPGPHSADSPVQPSNYILSVYVPP
jgi:hypothetical protein